MKVLVTGCDGYIGSVLSQRLADEGYDVIGIDTRYYKDCNLKNFTDLPNIKIIEKDIRDISGSDIAGIDAIIHLAALSNDPLGQLDPRLTTEINFSASVRLAELAKKNGVKKFVFASSCSMYGISKEDVVSENSRLEPLTEYAKSKMLTEVGLSKMSDKNFCPVYLRCATVFGISPKLRFDLVVNNLAGHAIAENKIVVNSDGTPWRPSLHVEDACSAFILTLESDNDVIRNNAYNTGSTKENYQIKDIADIVSRQTGCEVVMLGKELDSRSYKVDCSKIKNDLGFRIEWPLKKGVEDLVKKLRDIEINYSEFNSRKYTRLKQIEYLLGSGKLGSDLRWE